MRLVIDMQGAQTASRFRGIGRYTVSLTQAMVRMASPDHEILLVVNAQIPEGLWAVKRAFEGLLDQNNIRVFDVPAEAGDGGWGNAASEPIREAFIASLKPDAVLLTSVFEAHLHKAVTSIGRVPSLHKSAAILYDLIPLLHPETYLKSQEQKDFYSEKIATLKKTDLLLSISESSRQEALSYLGLPAESIVTISAAIGPEFSPAAMDSEIANDFLKTLSISKKFILYTPGGFDPRKNFERLIQAYSQLPEHIRGNHQLVIASKLEPDNRKQLIHWMKQYELSESELILPGYVNDEALVKLYSLTTLFVFPSLHEGFGLPVLEAMACGAPTIGSSCTSIPEVLGLEDALFDPLSVHSIREKLVKALSDQSYWAGLKKHSTLQAKRFKWDEVARKAWQALDKLVADSGRTHDKPDAIPSIEATIRSVSKATRHLHADEPMLKMAASCIAFNRGIPQRQLLLDVSVLANSDARSGIQRVVRSLLSECMKRPPVGFTVIPVRFDGARYWRANQAFPTINADEGNKEDEVVDFFQDDIYVCLDLLMHLGDELHCVHRDLAARGVHLNYIIYDLLPLQNPQWWDPATGAYFRRWIDAISQNANNLICISNAVSDELKEWLADNPPHRPFGKAHISSFHLGADLSTSLPSKGLPSDASVVLENMKRRTTFLMVSTIEPRKGHAQAIAAFEQLWSRDIDVCLVIVGKQGWMVDGLVQHLSAHPESGRRLLWLQNASDEFLERIYAESDCLVMASLGEGFGLPLVEAAQHKLPIIARDLPVLREIGEEHAYYFHGFEASDLSLAIQQWIDLWRQGKHPKSDNLPWLTWRSSAAQFLKAMHLSQ